MHNNHVKRLMSTKVMAYCALLTALSVVLARLIGLMPEQSTRFSIEAVPITLAGILFGPMAGGIVGFAADFVGCLLSPYGFNPIFSLPPILYGVFGGVFRWLLNSKVSVPRLTVTFACPVVLGSILYQSAALAFMYYKDGPFLQGYGLYLSTRSIQFAITLVLDVALTFFLLRSGLFNRAGLWPLKKKEKEVE